MVKQRATTAWKVLTGRSVFVTALSKKHKYSIGWSHTLADQALIMMELKNAFSAAEEDLNSRATDLGELHSLQELIKVIDKYEHDKGRG